MMGDDLLLAKVAVGTSAAQVCSLVNFKMFQMLLRM